jgi:hypothetical protein
MGPGALFVRMERTVLVPIPCAALSNVEPEGVREPAPASLGQGDGPSVPGPINPAELLASAAQRRPEATGEVRSPLAPVQTRTAE